MDKEKYKFQNVYLITTYDCNWNCQFCLFKHNKEKECSINTIIERLEYSILDSKEKVYLKITGGEPFLRPELLKAVFELCEKYKEKIYKIGIGTNGSIQLPDFFNHITIRTHIFLSRHHKNKLFTPGFLCKNVKNDFIDFRINCNLIKNGIDNSKSIIEYIDYMSEAYDINYFCFRELNKINTDKNKIYPSQIYGYMDYYKENVVYVNDIQKEIEKSSLFKKSKCTGNYYDNNIWYWYKNNISIKFRIIDEEKLIDYNTNNSDVDEYVIHPDGTLTGCWDKDLKIIKEA